MLIFFMVLGWALGAAVAVGVLLGMVGMVGAIVLHCVSPAKAK